MTGLSVAAGSRGGPLPSFLYAKAHPMAAVATEDCPPPRSHVKPLLCLKTSTCCLSPRSSALSPSGQSAFARGPGTSTECVPGWPGRGEGRSPGKGHMVLEEALHLLFTGGTEGPPVHPSLHFFHEAYARKIPVMMNPHPRLQLIRGRVSGHRGPSYSTEVMSSPNALSWHADGLARPPRDVCVLSGRAKAVPGPSVPPVQGTRVQGTGILILENAEGAQDDGNARTMLRLALFSFGFVVGLVLARSVWAGVRAGSTAQCWIDEALPG